MNNPLVSILMPVRNEEQYLNAAISSIKAQTFKDWELIVVDDGSLDRTGEILVKAATDNRIIVLQNPDKGLVPALNTGLALCSGKFIARMDGDDISHPERLAQQFAVFTEHPQTGLVASSFRHFPRSGLKIGMLAYEEWQNSLTDHDAIIADIFVESPFVHPGVMFKKEIVARLGGYRDMGWAEDYDLWLRMAATGVRFAKTGEPLIFWRDRPERATRTMNEYSADAFRRCKAHHLHSGFLRDSAEVVLAGAGKEGRAWQRVLAEIGITVSQWIDVDPKKKGRVLHGAEIVAPDDISPNGSKMLVTVGTRGARVGIREWATGAGFIEGKDFICVT